MCIRDQLDAIKAQKANPILTPHVGECVQWFDRNDDDRCYAAIVTYQEGPGRVKLTILKPNAREIHKEGVLHRSDPVHEDKHNTVTTRNGAWDFLPGVIPGKLHKVLHLKQLEQREAALLRLEREQTAAPATT